MNREIEAIIQACQQAADSGIRCALATVVHIEGSAYRRAGARMLVDEHGNMTGAISGGCLEGDALIKALHALAQEQNKLVTYDTAADSDSAIGAQLGCEGIIRVLFEPIHYQQPNHPVQLLQQASETGGASVIVSLFSLQHREPQNGTRFLFSAGNTLSTAPDLPEPLQQAIAREAHSVLAEGQSAFRQFQHGGNSLQAFFEWIPAPKKLVLVGAGNDARQLADMATLLDWQVLVIDGRPTHASAGRFMPSCQVVVSKPEKILEQVIVDNRSFFVLMTHNYAYDLAVLKQLLTIPEIPYIGILGPKKKYTRMLNDLRQQGMVPGEEQLQRIYAPVGLEIGAETPAEIALSMLAEMKAVMSATRPGHLRDKPGPIHEYDEYAFREVNLL